MLLVNSNTNRVGGEHMFSNFLTFAFTAFFPSTRLYLGFEPFDAEGAFVLGPPGNIRLGLQVRNIGF